MQEGATGEGREGRFVYLCKEGEKACLAEEWRCARGCSCCRANANRISLSNPNSQSDYFTSAPFGLSQLQECDGL